MSQDIDRHPDSPAGAIPASGGDFVSTEPPRAPIAPPATYVAGPPATTSTEIRQGDDTVNLSKRPADPAMDSAMAALADDVVGFITGVVVDVEGNEILGAQTRFSELSTEAAAESLVRYVESVDTILAPMGDRALFGDAISATLHTEAATVHVRRVDDSRFLLVVADPAADAVVAHSTVDLLDAYGPALAHLIV